MCKRRGCTCNRAQKSLVFAPTIPPAIAAVVSTAERIAKPREELLFAGVTEERTQCERCGRIELKRTVVLRRVIDGEPLGYVYFGVDCAAEALGRTRKGVLEEALRAELQRRIDARRADFEAHPAIVAVRREEERLEALGRPPSKRHREWAAQARARAMADLGIIDPTEKR
jgi:hypothetical protein